MTGSSFLPLTAVFRPEKRNTKKVPFVELFNGRVQGVVSSGSDINRVYVAFFEAGTGDFYCSTNNNRPCGGLSGSRPCSHIQEMVDEAIAQYGGVAVGKFLKIPNAADERANAWVMFQELKGSQKHEPANEVFSRFLSYLRYIELPPSRLPIPEMTWFAA